MSGKIGGAIGAEAQSYSFFPVTISYFRLYLKALSLLSIFRTNQLLASILYVPYLVLLRLPVYFFPDRQPIEIQGHDLFPEILDQLNLHWWARELFTFTGLIAIATYISITVAVQRVDREITLFPGLLFLLLSSLIPECLGFTFLIPAGFLVWAGIDQLSGTYRKFEPIYRLFNAGLWIGCASLFSPSFLLYLPVGLIGLSSLRSINLKEYYLIGTGFLTPFVLATSICFYLGRLPAFLEHYQSGFRILNWQNATSLFGLWALLPFAFFLIVVLTYRSYYLSKKSMAVRKVIEIVYLLLLFTGVVALFSADLNLDMLIVFSMPLSFFLCMNLSRWSPGIAEGAHVLLLALHAFFQYGPAFLSIG